MIRLPLLNEGDLDLLVAYSIDSDETMSEAIVSAFLAANVDVFEEPTVLVDWVDIEVLEDRHWSSTRPMYHSTRIWDRRVVITSEEVRIYAPSARP